MCFTNWCPWQSWFVDVSWYLDESMIIAAWWWFVVVVVVCVEMS